jgi:hypothetical protein
VTCDAAATGELWELWWREMMDACGQDGAWECTANTAQHLQVTSAAAAVAETCVYACVQAGGWTRALWYE